MIDRLDEVWKSLADRIVAEGSGPVLLFPQPSGVFNLDASVFCDRVDGSYRSTISIPPGTPQVVPSPPESP